MISLSHLSTWNRLGDLRLPERHYAVMHCDGSPVGIYNGYSIGKYIIDTIPMENYAEYSVIKFDCARGDYIVTVESSHNGMNSVDVVEAFDIDIANLQSWADNTAAAGCVLLHMSYTPMCMKTGIPLEDTKIIYNRARPEITAIQAADRMLAANLQGTVPVDLKINVDNAFQTNLKPSTVYDLPSTIYEYAPDLFTTCLTQNTSESLDVVMVC